MGYELSIKREDENKKINKQEWSDYIKSDPEFDAIEKFSAETNEGKTLTISTPDAGLWKSDKGDVPFTFYEEYGEITVKNPDHWIIEKMISIAKELNAIVEGEEGEKYDENYLKDPFNDPSLNSEKKWWQFWK